MLPAFEALLQVYVFAPPAVKLIEAPAHSAFVPVIATSGTALTVTPTVAVCVQTPTVPVTVYMPLAAGV